jgi:putative hemolysin
MRYDDKTTTRPGEAADRPRLRLALAESEADVQAAQRLRYRVFAEELAARLPSASEGIDRDRFDRFCEHLVVRDEGSGEVVGTYRILTAGGARRAGGFYSETEFDLTLLGPLRARMLEVGRACVHPEYRSGRVLSLLWAGLGAYVGRSDALHVIGCASVPLAPDPSAAVRVCRRLVREHLGPPEWRVFPHHPLRLHALRPADDLDVPPLIRGYLRMGAFVCGAPSLDSDFGTADLLLLLPVARMARRYAGRFLRAS